MPQIILKIDINTDKLVKAETISCYLLDAAVSANMVAEAVETGKPVLVEGSNALEFCCEHNLDGVVVRIDTSKNIKQQIKPLREKLKHKNLGVIIPPRRHEAMLASEVEPDFVAFHVDDIEAAKATIDWYNEFFLLPLAIEADHDWEYGNQTMSEFVIINAEKFKNSGC